MKKLLPYVGRYRNVMFLCVLLTMGEVVCELMIPLLMARIVDIGIPSGDLRFIAVQGAVMIFLAVLAILLGVLNAKYSAEASQGFAANLRQAMFHQLQQFSFTNIDTLSSASLITRLTSDITQLQVTIMMSLRILTRAPVMLVCALVIAMTIHFRLSLTIIVSIALLALFTVVIARKAGKMFELVQKKLDSLNGVVQENLIAIRVVKAFVREDFEREKFQKVNQDLTATAVQVGNVISMVMPVMILILTGTTIAVIWLGGHYVGSGAMGTGELMSFISYIMQILMSVMMFAMIFILLTRARACALRAVEVLETRPDLEDPVSEAPVSSPKKGRIEFNHVSFRYQGDSNEQNVLEDIHLTIEAGQFVGIIGGTGAGKTTLVSLIPRFYDVTAGAVLVDGVDVRQYSQKSLRDGIGMVMQKNNLFSGTIQENLLWGRADASWEEMTAAAESAQAHEFIQHFPDGYETELGQGGVNLSGGQKQRLCIARAMLKKPSILILDDSTSAVDTATEARIRQAFYEKYKDVTVLLVAQRISSVEHADQIIVMDDGGIVGTGTHEQLLRDNKVYQEIYYSQKEGGAA